MALTFEVGCMKNKEWFAGQLGEPSADQIRAPSAGRVKGLQQKRVTVPMTYGERGGLGIQDLEHAAGLEPVSVSK